MQVVLSFDLGTGGLKAGIYSIMGESLGFEFVSYETSFPQPDWHEQRPTDWWDAVCKATRNLLASCQVKPEDVCGVSSSGHSLVVVPIGEDGRSLCSCVPIWSDRRAKEEAAAFFKKVDYQNWYEATGNGDPPETYSLFKILWLQKHHPELFSKVKVFLGSKDYINFCLTGQVCTDFSYASGSGIYSLKNWDYAEDLFYAAGLDRSLFPPIVASHHLVGRVNAFASQACGLQEGTPVFCGGVDNSCMALGTTGIGKTRVYTSLGSSAWIAISSTEPVLDAHKLPFVFAHIEKGYFTSAVSIFAAGSALRWARETFCLDLKENAYDEMTKMADTSPIGANGLLFNPTLAGGSSQEPFAELSGAFHGLQLSHTRADLIRAILEGVALSLGCFCLPILEPYCSADQQIIFCGGGAKSAVWMQIFADIFDKKVVVVNVDQDAASLGAAAIALRGAGLWTDYSNLDNLFQVQKIFTPRGTESNQYLSIKNRFTQWVQALAYFQRHQP